MKETTHNGTEDGVPRVDDVGADDVAYIGRVTIPPAANASVPFNLK